MTYRIGLILGTRPEVIKLAPVATALREPGGLASFTGTGAIEVEVVAVRQHEALLEQALGVFGIAPERQVEIVRSPLNGGSVGALHSAIMDALIREDALAGFNRVLVQGDTSTALAGAMAAGFQQIPVGHVEAGLRTSDPRYPFPEELNRRLITRLADLHFAPTQTAAQALRREGIATDRIFVTGNTCLDALVAMKARPAPEWRQELAEAARWIEAGDFVLVTAHRRENWGAPIEGILSAVHTLALRFPATGFVFSLHPNPDIKRAASAYAGKAPNLHFFEHLDYATFAHLMSACRLVLTDSGGLQEEAPLFGKPVLVMREETERVEGLEAGTLKLVGTEPPSIEAAVATLLEDADSYRRMSEAENPYGDGQAAKRIAEVLQRSARGE